MDMSLKHHSTMESRESRKKIHDTKRPLPQKNGYLAIKFDQRAQIAHHVLKPTVEATKNKTLGIDR